MLSIVPKNCRSIYRTICSRMISSYRCVTQGELGKDFDYQCYIQEKCGKEFETISPWHDINYLATPYIARKPAVVNFIMEIPRGLQSAKTEISPTIPFNPIHQDVKKGSLRFYGAPSMIHYGAVPQTWENPNRPELTDIGSFCGDNDPLDILDFSYIPHTMGEVYPVMLFGAIALIDEGEMDWKLLAVNAADPACKQLRDYCDFFENYHNELNKMRTWLKTYKMVDGKGENRLAYEGMPYHEKDTWEMIVEPYHKEWKKLVDGEIDPGKLSLERKYK